MNLIKGKSIACLLFLGAFLLMAYESGAAQKSEHYNSPLYSPRTYDPNVSEANGIPEALKKIGIEQKLGSQLPLDAQFKDETGKIVRLGDYFNQARPVIIAFVYYECPMLCNQVLNGLTGSLKGITMNAGTDFDVVAISFDSREFDSTEIVKNKKLGYIERYGRPATEKGWHFLTGQQEAIDKVTSAAGFTYQWDEKTKQFAHAAAVMVATPSGRLSRYHYGIDYAPRDLKFSLMESAENRVGNAADQLLLYCYHYDPASGKYGLAILSVMRLGGIATMIGMGLMALVFWRRNKKRDQLVDEG
jgi:protein SCO1/2